MQQNKFFNKDSRKGFLLFQLFNPINECWWILCVAAVVIFKASHELWLRIDYELNGVFNGDTLIYWAIGRGMVNGLTLYKDLFDIKPPGIFILSASSYYLLDSPKLANYLSCLAYLCLAFIPILSVCFAAKRSKIKFDTVFIAIVSLLFGLIISLYSAERSGEIQVEVFGAVFLSIYALMLIRFPASENWSVKSVKFWIAVICLLSSFGFKEPFLFVSLSIAIIFSDNYRDFLRKYLTPLIVALSVGTLLLLLLGALKPFIELYLSFILDSHIHRFGSPFSRALNLTKIFNDLNSFSSGLGYLIMIQFLVFIFIKIKKLIPNSRINAIFPQFLKIIAIIYLTSFSVGVGGEFYNHHYVFAVPLYIAIFGFIVQNIHLISIFHSRVAWIILFLVTSFSAIFLPDINYSSRLSAIQRWEKPVIQEAIYVDKVLDTMKMSSYLFIGANLTQIYGFTRHSPQGPIFMQYNKWFTPEHIWFRKSFLHSLNKSSLIVFDKFNIGDLQNEVEEFLKNNFTEIPWPEVQDIPRTSKRYKILFRNKLVSVPSGDAIGK